FERRNDLVNERARLDAEAQEPLRRNAGHTWRASAEQRTLRWNRRYDDILAETLTQEGTHIAELIDQPEVLRGLGDPVFAGEHGFCRAHTPRDEAPAGEP